MRNIYFIDNDYCIWSNSDYGMEESKNITIIKFDYLLN